MANYNSVTLVGRLTNDPQVRFTTGGTAVCECDIVINSSYTNKNTQQKVEESTFVPLVVWGRTAEIFGEYLMKGSTILVAGRLKLETWKDKETQANRSKMKVVVESMQMMGAKGEKPSGAGGGQRSKSSEENRSENTQSSSEYSDGPAPGGDEVPF